MADYDDIIDEVSLFQTQQKARSARRRYFAQVLLIVLLVGIPLIGAASYFVYETMSRRRAIAQAPPRQLPAPEAVEAWPKIRPGERIPWTAAPDPSPGLMELAKDLKPFTLQTDHRHFEMHFASPAGSRFFVLYGPENRVFDSATGLLVGKSPGHEALVALHPEGRLLTHRTHDGFAVFNGEANKEVARIAQTHRHFHSFTGQMAGADHFLIRTESTKSIRFHVFDWVKGEMVADVAQPTSALHLGCGVLSPNGGYLAMVGRLSSADDPFGPDQLIVYNVRTGKYVGLKEIEPPPPPVPPFGATAHYWHDAAFSPDGNRFAALRSDGKLHLWDWATGELMFRTSLSKDWMLYSRNLSRPFSIVLYDEHEPILIGSRLYSCKLGTPLRLPGDQLHSFQKIDAYPAPGFVRLFGQGVRGNLVSHLIAFDREKFLQDNQGIDQFDPSRIPIAPLAAEPPPPKPGPVANPVTAWPPTDSGRILGVSFANDQHRALLVQDDSGRFVVESGLRKAKLHFTPLNLETGVADPPFQLTSPDLLNMAIGRCVALSPDGKTVCMVALDDPRTVEVRDLKGQKLFAWRPNFQSDVQQLAFVANGRLLVQCESELIFCKSMNGKYEGVFRMPKAVLHALDPSQTVMLVSAEGLGTFDVRTGARLVSFDPAKTAEGSMIRYTISPDGRSAARLSSRQRESALTVWSTETGRVLFETKIAHIAARPLEWIDADSLWMGDVIFSVSRQQPVRWIRKNRIPESAPIAIAGRLHFVSKNGTLLRPDWPDAQAIATLDSLEKNLPRRILTPGDRVRVICTIEKIPQRNLLNEKHVKMLLETALKDRGFLLDDSAAVTLRCDVSQIEPDPGEVLAKGFRVLLCRLEWHDVDGVIWSDQFETQQLGEGDVFFIDRAEDVRNWIIAADFRTILLRTANGPDPIPTAALNLVPAP